MIHLENDTGLEHHESKYTTVWKSVQLIIIIIIISFNFLKDMNTFIEQGYIKLFKNDTKGVYNVTKEFYFK